MAHNDANKPSGGNGTGKSNGAMRTRLLRSGVIETLITGYVTSAIVERHIEEFRRALAAAPATAWLIDGMGIEGFEASVGITGRELLKVFKGQGGTKVYVASPKTSVRMVLATAGFVAGLPIATGDTRDAALALLPK